MRKWGLYRTRSTVRFGLNKVERDLQTDEVLVISDWEPKAKVFFELFICC